MSKINQIQKELQSLGDAAFQKLADAYLHKKGYEQINAIGSVIGADKVRKGTPDTLIALPDGNYVFAEYTTQQDRVLKKFQDDLNKCLDEKKTGIPVCKISEIIFCYTSGEKLEPFIFIEDCRKRGINVKITIFGIDSISYDLYQNYPGIARDFLGIAVDTGQIVTPDEFIALYNKNAIATPLNTTFLFREQELKKAIKCIEETNLVLISGKAGIGKSRFVLEICRKFVADYPEYNVRCIFLKKLDIFEDLKVYFSAPGKYLIFVDDANRVSRFEYFIQLLHDRRENQEIKVIATVRDYALDKLINTARSYKNFSRLELNLLEDEQIKKLVENEYEITNPSYLNRIADISQGNPRLAFMTSKVAKQENSFESIIDVSSIYDEYYRSIRQDLEDLDDKNLLKTAGIIAFFRIFDFSDEQMIKETELEFNIPKDVLWESVCRLHDLEILDMYEDRVVRTSDQVLSTYLFYRAFFVKRAIEFSSLLKRKFFPHLKDELVDVLNPVVNTFYSQKIIDILRPPVDKAWTEYKNKADETSLMHLIEVFWFLKETDILSYVHNRILEIEPEVMDISTLEIKHSSPLSSPSFLSILGLFINSNIDNFRLALELLFIYLSKCPSLLPNGLYILTERFGFKPDSYNRGFENQKAVIDVLWEQTDRGKNELFSKLFLAVAERYLKTEFMTERMKDTNIEIRKFCLLATVELLELRSTIWQRIFQLYQVSIFEDAVLALIYQYHTFIYTYSRYDRREDVDRIIKGDAKEILSFINSMLKFDSYSHCLVVQQYLDVLENYKVWFDQQLRSRFTNQTYTLSKLFLSLPEAFFFDSSDQPQIVEEFKNYSFSDYEQFFDRCIEIDRAINISNYKVLGPMHIAYILIYLSNRDSNLYLEVMKYYLLLGDPFQISKYGLVNRLIQICGVEKAYEFLNQPDYLSKRQWLFSFYFHLPQEKITIAYLEQLYNLFKQSTPNEVPHHLDFLLNYRSIDEDIIVRVTEILLERSTEHKNFSEALGFIILLRSTINENLIELFRNRLDLLKQAYFTVLKTDYPADAMHTFVKIIDIDPNFILEFIDWVYKQKDETFHYLFNRPHRSDLSFIFIWKRNDYEELIDRAIDHIYKIEKDKRYLYLYQSLKEKIFILKPDRENPEIDYLLNRTSPLTNRHNLCYQGISAVVTAPITGYITSGLTTNLKLFVATPWVE